MMAQNGFFTTGTFLRRFFPLALAIVLGLVGCSDDQAPETADVVQGKTPVVRPEDVHGRGAGGAAVLAPDYRRDLNPDPDAEPVRAPRSQAAVVSAKDRGPATPDFGRLVAGKPPPPPPTASTPAKTVPAPSTATAGTSSGFPVAGCRQLVLVVAPDFTAGQGRLRRFERAGPNAAWREVGGGATCALGRKGLGVGRGLMPSLSGPDKRQGDGRTPAGLFPLPEAFGYASQEEARTAGARLPYRKITDRTACVTDPDSGLFGKVVGSDERPAGAVLRQERMVRSDGANVWGVVIGHNRENPEPQAGTCLFINVRPVGGPPTGGSIGCPREVAEGLVAWLDQAAEPLLAVLPEKEYQSIRTAWGLP